MRAGSARTAPALSVSLAALFVTAAAHAGNATVISSLDTTIFESTQGLDLSNALGSRLFAGYNGQGERRRGLVYFDVSEVVPAGATINTVTVQMSMVMSNAGDVDVALHRALRAWGEGTSEAPGGQGGGTFATAGDATWDFSSFDDQAWTDAGGDFIATPSDTVLVGGIGDYGWISPSIVADVQAWVDDPSSNFGWFVIGDEFDPYVPTAKAFATHEEGNVAMRPHLYIDYTIPGPGGLAVLAVGGLLRGRRRRA